VVVWKQLNSTFAPILNIFFNANAFYPSSFETCQHAIMRVPRLYFSPTLCSSTGHSTMFASKIHTKIRTSSKNVFSSALSLHELCRPSKNHKIFLPNQDPPEPEICTISGASTLEHHRSITPKPRAQMTIAENVLGNARRLESVADNHELGPSSFARTDQ
jgi:hypothetical protein